MVSSIVSSPELVERERACEPLLDGAGVATTWEGRCLRSSFVKFNLSFLLSFSFLAGVLEIAARYEAEEVIGEEACLVVDADVVEAEAEVEGEAVLVGVAGDGSVWMATVHILG